MSEIHKKSCRAPAVSRRSRTGTNPPNPPGRLRNNGRGTTTVEIADAAMQLLGFALPFTAGVKGPQGQESKGEFTSIAVAERVARLKAEHGFILPPKLSLELPLLTKSN